MELSAVMLGVIGLGYAGLPLAVEFDKRRNVTGFDINTQCIAGLQFGHGHTLEVESGEL